MAMIDLYTSATANGHALAMFLAETRLPHRVVRVNRLAGEQPAPALRAISPGATLPALVDHEPPGGGAPLALFEPGAMLVYLAEKTGQLLAHSARLRAEALAWLFWHAGGLARAAGGHETQHFLEVLDTRLADREFIVNGYSVVDIACFPSILPDSRIDHVARSAMDWPGGKAGEVVLVEFTLAGLSYQGLNGGPHDKFNDAISLSILCRDQAEVDHLWSALSADGGRPMQCGWLKDKYGLSWQIVPEELLVMLRDRDPRRNNRVMEAMVQMVKLDLAGLRRAYEGPT